MPITKQNYKNFYLGTGAEFHLMSAAFLLGYEAHKITPDVGLDILVTNKARQKFESADPINLFLQVKSTFLINGEAIFFIEKDDLDMLANDQSAVIVFCYFSPIIKADPKSFSNGFSDTEWFEREEASWMQQLYDQEFRLIRKDGNSSSIEFKGLPIDYFWLNNQQLKRAINEGIFFACQKNTNLQTLIFTRGENGSCLRDKDGIEQNICSEIENIFYLLNGCHSDFKIKNGDFLLAHY